MSTGQKDTGRFVVGAGFEGDKGQRTPAYKVILIIKRLLVPDLHIEQVSIHIREGECIMELRLFSTPLRSIAMVSKPSDLAHHVRVHFAEHLGVMLQVG